MTKHGACAILVPLPTPSTDAKFSGAHTPNPVGDQNPARAVRDVCEWGGGRVVGATVLCLSLGEFTAFFFSASHAS